MRNKNTNINYDVWQKYCIAYNIVPRFQISFIDFDTMVSLVRVSGGKCVRNWCNNVERTKRSNDSRGRKDKYIILTRRFRFGQHPSWGVNINPDISHCIRSDSFRLRSEPETNLVNVRGRVIPAKAGRNLTPPVNKRKYTYTATNRVLKTALIPKIKDVSERNGANFDFRQNERHAIHVL